jgi:hypothetical protein
VPADLRPQASSGIQSWLINLIQETRRSQSV